MILALVAVAAFLIGRRSEGPPLADAPPPLAPQSHAPHSLAPPPLVRPPLATAPLTPAPAAPANAVPVAAPPVAIQTAPALARAQAEIPRSREPHSTAAQREPALHLRPEQVRAVRQIVRTARVQVDRSAAPRALGRPAYGPRAGPSGRVVQLGAYRSVAEAEASAQAFRYKYRGLLEPLPKAVLPFRLRNSNRMFYRVQFVTPSQVYSEVTCQRLRAAGKSCIVIY